MPYEGMPLARAREIGEIPERNTTRVKRLYPLPCLIEVEAEQDYVEWFEENIIKEGLNLTDDDIINGTDDTFMPDYNSYIDDDYFCEHPHNYAYAAWCEGIGIKLTIAPLQTKDH